jgi:hypothetical protein
MAIPVRGDVALVAVMDTEAIAAPAAAYRATGALRTGWR